MAKLSKDLTAVLSFRIDKKLKKSLKKKYGRKLSEKVTPFLKEICDVDNLCVEMST